MKRVLVLLLCLLMANVTLAVAADKFGYVDLQRVLLESNSGKVAKETISKKVQELKAQVNAKQDELKKLKGELENQGVMLTPDAKAQKEREYQQKLKDFQRFTKDSQDQLQQQDSQFTHRILREVLDVVRAEGKKEGYTMILEKSESSLIYADKSIDMTDQVIKLYNQKSKKK